MLGLLPRYDSPKIPELNELLSLSLRDDFIGIAKTIKLCYVDRKDKVHPRHNASIFGISNHRPNNRETSSQTTVNSGIICIFNGI